MAHLIDDDDFDDFLAKVNEVDATIKGLNAGTIQPDEIDDTEIKLQEMEDKKQRKKAAVKAKKQAEVDKKKQEKAEKDKYVEDNYEHLMEKVDALKRERKLKEQARNRFGKWREKKSKTLVCDYQGWDLWEPDEEPDDDIYKDMPPPDTPELRAMEKDIVERGKRKKAREIQAEKDKEAGNRAFKAQQYSEALRCYDNAIDNAKCTRVMYTNRAFAHIKLGNWARAVEDCDRCLYIGEHFEATERMPDGPRDKTTAKALMRRSMAHSGRGDLEGAASDLEEAQSICPKDETIKKLLKRAQMELGEQEKENEVTQLAEGGENGKQASGAFKTIRECVQQLSDKECAADEAPPLLKKLGDALTSDELLVYARTAGALGAVCGQCYTSAATDALKVLYQLVLNQRSLEQLVARKGFLSHLTDLVQPTQPAELREQALSVLAEGSRFERCRQEISEQSLGAQIAAACESVLAPPTTSSDADAAAAAAAAVGADGGSGLHAQQAYAATLLGNLATDAGFRNLLHGRAESLLEVLLANALSPFVDVAQKSASALTNLANDAAWRGKVGEKKRLGLLCKVIQIDLSLAGKGGGQLAEVVQSALGVLANCALEAPVQELLVQDLKVVPIMVALLKPPITDSAKAAPLIARAIIVLSRCARQPGAPELLAGLGAFEKVLGCLPTYTKAAIAAEEPAESEACRLVDAAGRLLAVCAMNCVEAVERMAAVKGGLKAVVGLLEVGSGTTQANVSLCIANMGKVESTLRGFGKAGAVPALINLAHRHELEQARQNAGIALARLSKEEKNLEQLKELHGIEIIHHYVKPLNMQKKK
jgi:hypothetical protein